MMVKRQKKQYTEEQLRGMQIVGRILKDTRLNNGYTTRAFAVVASTRAKYDFAHGRVQIFEAAGRVTDKRTDTVNSINPAYLGAIAPLTPYPLKLLKELYEGDAIELLQGAPMLKDLIEQKAAEMGKIAFRRECNRLELSEEDIVEAKKGNLLSADVAIALSMLLKIPIDEIYLGAIAAINQELD